MKGRARPLPSQDGGGHARENRLFLKMPLEALPDGHGALGARSAFAQSVSSAARSAREGAPHPELSPFGRSSSQVLESLRGSPGLVFHSPRPPTTGMYYYRER
jgi:hypothetical protein